MPEALLGSFIVGSKYRLELSEIHKFQMFRWELGCVVWKVFEPILDKLGAVEPCLMEVGGGGVTRTFPKQITPPLFLLPPSLPLIEPLH